jgi:hypothetical protein
MYAEYPTRSQRIQKNTPGLRSKGKKKKTTMEVDW